MSKTDFLKLIDAIRPVKKAVKSGYVKKLGKKVEVKVRVKKVKAPSSRKATKGTVKKKVVKKKTAPRKVAKKKPTKKKSTTKKKVNSKVPAIMRKKK